MSYDELKQAVIDKLTGTGFTQDGDKLEMVQVKRSQIVINGEAHMQEQEAHIVFTILGEGAIDDKPTIGLNLHIEEADAGDFWIGDVDDLKYFFRIK